MKKPIIIDDGIKSTLKWVYIFEIPFYWIYCKIKDYKFYIYERRDLD